MRAVIQRVHRASVRIQNETMAQIGRGLVVLLAVGKDDTPDDIAYVVDKTLNLRIFPDGQGRFDRSALDTQAGILLVSQFTLYGDTRRGRRPSFSEAASPDAARERFDETVERFRGSGLAVETGQFQAMMDVELVNDGPVTIWIDSVERTRPRG